MSAKQNRRHLLWLSLVLSCGVAHAEGIARIESAEGVVVAEHEGRASRSLGKGSILEKGEIVVTQNGSHALLIFNDQTKVAVRPNSQLQLTDFVFHEQSPKQDSFVLNLLKGGLRQVTGFIGRNKSAYRLQAQSATIGIRGTDFTARLCEGLDCNIEQSAAQREQAKTAPASGTVGKAVWVQGSVSAKNESGILRQLSMASPVFQGDVIITGAEGAAGFVMIDNTRLVLAKDSQVSLTQYSFVASKSDEGHELVDLLKGGLRVVSGLLGKLHNDRVQYRAGTATIGIRGTAFDMVCAGASCLEGSLQVSMRSGEISLGNGKNDIVVGAGQFASIPKGAPPRLTPPPPQPLLSPQLPKPEDIKADPVKLFGLTGSAVSKGLYVSVNAGEVVLANAGKEVVLPRGSAGFTGAVQAPVQLPAVPGFMDNDRILAHYTLTSALSCGH